MTSIRAGMSSTPRTRCWGGWRPRLRRSCAASYKPTFTPHMNGGDFVIVVNAAKVAVTRGREDKKIYYRHSQYPGGLKQETLRQALEKHPERVIERAVKGMLPHNHLGDDMLRRLKVYARPGASAPGAAAGALGAPDGGGDSGRAAAAPRQHG